VTVVDGGVVVVVARAALRVVDVAPEPPPDEHDASTIRRSADRASR